MKQRSPWQYLMVLLLLVISCGPSDQDVLTMIETNNYDALFQYYQSLDNDDRIESIPGYESPTLYEQAVLALVFSNTKYSKELLENSSRNENRAILLTIALLQRPDTIVQGIRPFIYQAYKSKNFTFDKSTLRAMMKRDTAFRPLILDDIEKMLESSFSTDDLIELANLANVELPIDLITKIREIPDQVAKIRSEEKSDDDLTRALNRELFLIEREIRNIGNNSDIDITAEIVENSYIFKGYMVAFIDKTVVGDVYEVRDLNSSIYLLQTIDTRFTSKGFFEIRVLGTQTEIPMTIKDGGFTRDIPMITEMNQSLLIQYNEYHEEFSTLANKKREIQNKILAQQSKRMKSPEEYEALIQSKLTELNEAKNELKTWFQRRL